MTDSINGIIPGQFTAFRFASFDFDRRSGESGFRFELVGPQPLEFTERVAFAMPEEPSDVDWPRVEAVLPLLGVILGLSYYKAAAPGRYEVAVPGLSRPAVDYLAAALRAGLGEFAYRNRLAGLLKPDIVLEHDVSDTKVPVAFPPSLLERPLVPIGGGKDSVVSVESLRKAGLRPTQFAVRPNSIIRRVAAAAGLPFIEAGRLIDPLLLQLNSRGALNGHVPVTAMNTLIGVVQSLLSGLGPVVLSNERSASDPTLVWDGVPINHQWSKSLEAELLLEDALAAQLGYRGMSFSLLRPYSELRIASNFSRISGYDPVVVSCNRAYRLGAGDVSWCGDCDKCRFIFLVFAPFMTGERLVGIFGKNLFEDATQVAGFRDLLGLGLHKPFECVGEEAECSVAMSLAVRQETWRDTVVARRLIAEAPALLRGDPGLEAEAFSCGPAQEFPTTGYREALHAYD